MSYLKISFHICTIMHCFHMNLETFQCGNFVITFVTFEVYTIMYWTDMPFEISLTRNFVFTFIRGKYYTIMYWIYMAVEVMLSRKFPFTFIAPLWIEFTWLLRRYLLENIFSHSLQLNFTPLCGNHNQNVAKQCENDNQYLAKTTVWQS